MARIAREEAQHPEPPLHLTNRPASGTPWALRSLTKEDP
jgi:hypothetical protein